MTSSSATLLRPSSLLSTPALVAGSSSSLLAPPTSTMPSYNLASFPALSSSPTPRRGPPPLALTDSTLTPTPLSLKSVVGGSCTVRSPLASDAVGAYYGSKQFQHPPSRRYMRAPPSSASAQVQSFSLPRGMEKERDPKMYEELVASA